MVSQDIKISKELKGQAGLDGPGLHGRTSSICPSIHLRPHFYISIFQSIILRMMILIDEMDSRSFLVRWRTAVFVRGCLGRTFDHGLGNGPSWRNKPAVFVELQKLFIYKKWRIKGFYRLNFVEREIFPILFKSKQSRIIHEKSSKAKSKFLEHVSQPVLKIFINSNKLPFPMWGQFLHFFSIFRPYIDKPES